MEIQVTDESNVTEMPPPDPTKSARRHGGPRPNSGGARPGAGKKPKDPALAEKTPSKLNLSESDLSPARRSQLVLPPLPSARNCRPAEMIKWWHSLTSEHLKHLCIYVYRTWPQIDNKKTNPKAVTNIGQYTDVCPFGEDTWETDIMREFGSGTYRFAINEDSINRWTVYTPALRDLENYPPLIDYRTLMIDEPANKDFVDWARTRGKLDSIGLMNEGDDMANAALERMADSNEKLTDRMLDMADRVAAASSAMPNTAETEAQLKVIEIMDKGSTRALDTVIGIMDRQAASKEKQSDPMEMVNTIIALTQSLNKNDGKADKLMEMMLEESRERSKRLEDEMREIRRGKEKEEGEDEKGLLGSLSKLGEIKGILTDLGIIKPDAAPDTAASGSGKESITAILIKEGLSKLPGMIGEGGISGLLSSFAQVIAAAKMQPVAANAGAIGAVPQPNPSVQPMNSQQPAHPPKPAPIVIQGYPMPSRTGVAALDELNLIIWRVTPTFIHHLSADNLDGYTFARWFIESDATGRQRYDQMKEGEEQEPGVLKKILEGYTPLWNVISTTPAKLDKFLGEFIRLDTWEAEEAMEGDDDEPPQPVAAAPAKNVKGTVIK